MQLWVELTLSAGTACIAHLRECCQWCVYLKKKKCRFFVGNRKCIKRVTRLGAFCCMTVKNCICLWQQTYISLNPALNSSALNLTIYQASLLQSSQDITIFLCEIGPWKPFLLDLREQRAVNASIFCSRCALSDSTETANFTGFFDQVQENNHASLGKCLMKSLSKRIMVLMLETVHFYSTKHVKYKLPTQDSFRNSADLYLMTFQSNFQSQGRFDIHCVGKEDGGKRKKRQQPKGKELLDHMRHSLVLLLSLKPVLNWVNVCSPEHTSDTSTNYD